MLRRQLVSLAVRLASASLALALAPRTAEGASLTKGPWVQRVTSRSAVVRVEVEPPGPVVVELAAPGGDAGGPRTLRSAAPQNLHSVALEGLTPGTRYTYRVEGGGGARTGSFVTAPPDDATAAFRFLAYGDNRSDDAAHAAVVRAMTGRAADFLVHTGDFVEDGGSPEDWKQFFEIEAPLLRDRCLYSAVGNHELTDGAGVAYARYFGPGEPSGGAPGRPAARALVPEHLNSTFRWGNTRFFLVNGMVEYRRGVDRAWLERALDEADIEAGLVWRIVVVHHGPWSSGPHGNNRLLLQADVPALLRAHKVDLIFAGHDHIYERGTNEGLPYVVTGGGGAPTYRVKEVKPWARKIESARHFVEVEATSTSLELAATRIDGTFIERCGLEKGKGWSCDAPPPPAAAPQGDPGASPATSRPAESSSRCGCRIVGGSADASENENGKRVSAVAGALVAATILARRRRGAPRRGEGRRGARGRI